MTLTEYGEYLTTEPLVLCQEAAFSHGLTNEQAEDCDEGDCNCPSCPWKDRLSLHFSNPQDVV